MKSNLDIIQDITTIKGKIILDVNGVKHTTSVDTLTRMKDTFFAALFSGRWELERDSSDNSIFIGRDGHLFKYILSYLRTDKIHNNVMTDETLRRRLIIEADYFCLHNLVFILTEPDRRRQEEERLAIEKSFPNGTLLRLEHKVKLNEFYGKINQKWKLIYKATRDGFGASAFHSCCNYRGPTMTIIQSNNNYIFGGYTSISWTSSGWYREDQAAFLFTLTNPHNIPPRKYNIQLARAAYAVCHADTKGPTFGNGHDMFVCDDIIANKPLNIISSYEYAQHEHKLHGLADCVKNPNQLIVFHRASRE
ncbi:unnamed protein product [Adineta steineri]|uniref:TLDc domain-containing protein n=2 Tax=Adineta steineri TaxID=433720 RepID=A0A814GXJ7_9BILA|nr:unnamed protein product [Adineta steineri]